MKIRNSFEKIACNNKKSVVHYINTKLEIYRIHLLEKHFTENPLTREISIVNCKMNRDIFSRICSALHSQTALTTLHFSENYLDASSMKDLAPILQKNSLLQILSLTSNAIGDEGLLFVINALKNHKNIAVLYLKNTNITDKGAEYLGNFLKENNSLEKLFLDENNITNKGLQLICEGLRHNDTLASLTYNSASIDPKINANIQSQTRVNGLFLLGPFSHNLTKGNISFKKDDKNILAYKQNVMAYSVFFNVSLPLEIIERIGTYLFKETPILCGGHTPFVEEESFLFTRRIHNFIADDIKGNPLTHVAMLEKQRNRKCLKEKTVAL